MENNFIQQMLVNFYKELDQILLPENAVTFNSPIPESSNPADKNISPLINIYPPRVKSTDFFDILHQVAGIIKKTHPNTVAEIDQIESALPVEPAEQESFVGKAFIPGINLLAYLQQDLPADTFGLLLNHTVKLFMRQYVEKVLPLVDTEDWLKGNCPVCGGRPNFALLEKESGGRYLYCGLCETKWRFQRLGCPFCYSNESQFITIEGMDKYRVYVCEECRGYIKTVDERKAGEDGVNLFLEDINTMHLDLLAISEGYFNKQLDPPPGL
ncbi:formate dehydrogenase accessory protein FdhE [Pelotomaculum terephthalicicum JT]|uniref:formate dehydrogenase accessory protein FdhE n=1 Tax=Pelotomaculum TaxID=191373 RepID=UPI0009C85C2F|nr:MULTISPECIES: formate dehydrogenase accessory protein FdhE [Pelotomaculum]MCG9969340.1 formate dehydrogenase accessory protein FdhE [Pelotomaculum terephthalicicum JT]OPX86406.1 MAG: formate dehydrogenase accessory protein FdhE [Pelotomaculum sp. PtaB.Bin117]OPY62133.1 MAG: formate dehydrogenase accessory protein FdhE [Pelotomaculum sp. PtaU1.Bin065]